MNELGGGRVKAGRAPAAGRREEKLLTSIADPMYEAIYVVEQRLELAVELSTFVLPTREKRARCKMQEAR